MSGLRGWMLLLVVGLLLGCQNELHEQPKFSKPFEEGAARPLQPHTVARGSLREEAPREGYPFELTAEWLERGQEQYDIFCAPCHGLTGDGQGVIVQRGFSPPPSFHSDALREAPPAHVVHVITEGLGRMFSYADRVPYEDRWAIAAYIQALQLSQQGTLEDVPEPQREGLAP